MFRIIPAIIALILAIDGAAVLAQQSGDLASPEAYGLTLARPAESKLASIHDLRYRLPGSLLGGWIVEGEAGNATLYVVAQQHEEPLEVEAAAATIGGQLVAVNLQPRSNTQMSLLGLPAFALSVEGPGYGTALSSVGGAPTGGTVPTYMRVVGIPLTHEGEQAPHRLLLFVAVSPAEALDTCRSAMEELLTGSRLQASSASAAVQDDEPTPAVAPAGSAAQAATAPQASPQQTDTLPSPVGPTTPQGFYLNLKKPDGWASASAADLADRIDGEYLAGWIKNTDHGRAAIYVLGKRAAGKFIVGQLGEAMHQSLIEAGLEADLEPEITALGRPGFMLSVWGQGTGLSLNELSRTGNSGSVPSFLRLITVANPWQGDTPGIDFLKFVAVGPLKSVNECLNALGDMVENSQVTGAYRPAPAVAEARPDPAPVSAPVARPEVSGAASSVFGSIYVLDGGDVSMRSVRVLRAFDESGTDRWHVPADAPSNMLLILVSSDGMKAWVLAGSDLSGLGELSGGSYAITDGIGLIPYRANWQELLR